MRNKWRKHMKMHFRKIALATAVSAAMAGVSLPAQAILTGVAGEALLVPLVVWLDEDRGRDRLEDLNTLIEVEIPSDIGHEDVANIWTAPNTTTAGDMVMAYDPAVFVQRSAGGNDRPYNAIHWFWFNHRSLHLRDQTVPVTPNDIVSINWREASDGDFEGQPGYMVIVNEAARGGAAAQFPMFGNAWLVNDVGGNEVEAEIPVLALADGEDTTPYPVWGNHVIYNGGIPSQVSPLASGMLTNYANGNLGDFAVFDMLLADLDEKAYHVIWLDANRAAQNNVGGYTYTVNVDVFDSEERECSTTVNLPHELNIVCITDDGSHHERCPTWRSDGELWQQPGLVQQSEDLPVTAAINLCNPGRVGVPDGYVQYQLMEVTDRGSGMAETAGVAFSILETRTVGKGNDDDIDRDTAAAQYRGMFRTLTN
jgi:hypothetical protein